MDISLKMQEPAQWSTNVLIAHVFEGDGKDPRPDAAEAVLSQLSAELKQAAPWLAAHPGLADVTGKAGELFLLHGSVGSNISRILLAGLGRRARLAGEAACLKALRNSMGEALRHCRELGMRQVAVSLPDVSGMVSMNDTIKEVVAGSLLGLYRQTAFKSAGAKELARTPDPETLCVLSSTMFGDDLHRACIEGTTSARAVCRARDLINTPPNRLVPDDLAVMARNLVKDRTDMTCTVLDENAMREQGLNALLSVGAGSVHAPRLVALEYAPHGRAQDKPLVFVGKGITFDSGGLSLKPAAGMERMKGDMAGAAAVFALFTALAELTPACRVVGLLACAENMPDANATRPGDVVTTLAGKTVEIVNTDAEGRLVLCDTLTYAQKHWQPAFMVDIATLTGACAVALGSEMAGLFSRDALLTERLRGLADRVGEPLWPLPLFDGFFEKLKSETADFANSGCREGGACIAAIFLAQFVDEDIRWAHLDIAGTSFSEKKGATGYAVRTCIELCLKGTSLSA